MDEHAIALVHRHHRTPDGTTIAYSALGGRGPDVLLLHGLAGSGREMLESARALGGRRAIVVDQRGHGRSTRVPTDTSREAFVADVVGVLERESSGPSDLVGQSMGGHTAMLVAAARPDLVRRLVLLEVDEGSGSEADREAMAAYFRSWPVPFADETAARAALGDGALERAWVADLECRADGLHPRFDADVMAAVAAGVARPRWEEWGRVSAPTLVVYADGGMFTPATKDRFVAAGRDVTRVDLAGASHDAHLDATDAWLAVLRDFLDAP
ncbi:alpha/beta fold hydrolase [Litorihabitans aurantiacus]|uniref:AB hydrolase-1 domain-containing protein n=1 Tax=Litorihabitans aurantiacus TaxID=1930061 RepID=A0AA37XGU1_9MICO|nr:alpha/beta hydrolase [Litorihabitans aurantiacus]GMA32984.1 hypothetical protein GCM10025875_29760 [Litorihabitans aurantiacus]